jgi:hypothetical protein
MLQEKEKRPQIIRLWFACQREGGGGGESCGDRFEVEAALWRETRCDHTNNAENRAPTNLTVRFSLFYFAPTG